MPDAGVCTAGWRGSSSAWRRDPPWVEVRNSDWRNHLSLGSHTGGQRAYLSLAQELVAHL